ncbi:response regulator transcription factor [Fodinibius saliphilus]|uniref:response regulator transcription factor n=1 Tax=Fodinibius saliphilus TaxID=1920650 RepID=UPI00110942F3|nr:response regulator transcription factor [Fodinibius saliphilus]
MKLLIVEDNQDLLQNIHTYLKKEGYICESAKNYEQAFHKVMSYTYDVVLIDIMIPGGSGLQVLRKLKAVNPETGTIIISAKNALDDKVEGLELGADDYVTKPFQLPELHARIKAINRRQQHNGRHVITMNELTINTKTMEVTVNDNTADLTPKEYELLVYFTANKNHVLSKQTIAEHLWGDYVDHLDNLDFVYQHIKNLRKKLKAAGATDYIESVYGIGYKFNVS